MRGCWAGLVGTPAGPRLCRSLRKARECPAGGSSPCSGHLQGLLCAYYWDFKSEQTKPCLGSQHLLREAGEKQTYPECAGGGFVQRRKARRRRGLGWHGPLRECAQGGAPQWGTGWPHTSWQSPGKGMVVRLPCSHSNIHPSSLCLSFLIYKIRTVTPTSVVM